jgi:transaldolase
MEELRNSEDEVIKLLDPKNAQQLEIPQLDLNEANFRWHMNEDAMATEKLAEGIRNFTKDTLRLEEFACRACASH